MENSNFRVDILGDLEYEDLVADIYFNDEPVAMLSQEKGFDNLEIEIYPCKSRDKWQFKYSEFEKVLQSAKQGLWELRKIDDKES